MKSLEIYSYGILYDFMQMIGKIKISTIVVKIIVMIIAFIYFLCLFDYIVARYEIGEEQVATKKKEQDDFTIKLIIGVLNLVYFVFCIIQIKSLFMKKVDINYANYARQGFFQLMIVSIINLITILIAKKRGENNKYIKIMSIFMIGFTFIILISSVVRMYFYESAYGYTFLRLLVYCVLGTETILLIPTILYILNKPINLSKIYFITIVTIYVGMNFANFDSILAKRNVNRYFETGKIDISYLKYEIGINGAKEMMRILEDDASSEEIKAEVSEYLTYKESELGEEKMGVADFNLSKLLAKYGLYK